MKTLTKHTPAKGEIESKYEIELTRDQRTQIEALTVRAFTLQPKMWRNQWLLIAYALLGQAQMIETGRFNTASADGKAWVKDLQLTANTILDFFQPGNLRL